MGQGLESLEGSRAWQEAGLRWRQEEERCCRSQSQFSEVGREGGGRVGFQALSLGEGPGRAAARPELARGRGGRADGCHTGALTGCLGIYCALQGLVPLALELMFHSLQRVFEVTFNFHWGNTSPVINIFSLGNRSIMWDFGTCTRKSPLPAHNRKHCFLKGLRERREM